MLRTPDILDEARVFAEAAERQGGDPETAWNALTCLSGKILNRVKDISGRIGTGSLTVLLTDDYSASAAFCRGREAVRIDETCKVRL